MPQKHAIWVPFSGPPSQEIKRQVTFHFLGEKNKELRGKVVLACPLQHHLMGRHSWIRLLVDAHIISIPPKNRDATNPRPHMEGSRRGQSRSAGLFLCNPCLRSYFLECKSRVSTKIIPEEFDSPCQILLCRGLKSF